MSSRQNYITEDHLLQTTYAMMTLTSIFILARIVTTQVVRPKRWLPQDAIIYFAYALYLVMTILYILVTPILFRLTAVGEKTLAPYPTLKDEHRFMVKVFFCNTLLFWFVLWAVKLGFLVLYKKLMEGLHNVYIKLWWAVLTLWFLSLLGSIASHMMACSSIKAWFTPGACQTRRDVRSQIASLYYTYAVDVLTDLMIMALPIRLIWNLRMPRTQKLGIVCLFGVGAILIAVATLRVAQIGGKAQSSSQPSASWLALWGVIECSIAIIIGCCPAFVTLIKNHTTPSVSYNTQGFVRQRNGEHECGDGGPDAIKLNSIAAGESKGGSSTNTKDATCVEQGTGPYEFVPPPHSRDVVDEVVGTTPMGKKKIRVRRGAR